MSETEKTVVETPEPVKAEPAPESQAKGELVSGIWRRFNLNTGASPLIGAVAVAGVVSALAVEIGVAELGVGALAGYAVYRMLRNGIPLPEAFVEGLQFEKEVVQGAH